MRDETRQDDRALLCEKQRAKWLVGVKETTRGVVRGETGDPG